MKILDLKDKNINQEEFGSKACNLSLVAQNGFNVPSGFAISCDIFDIFLEDLDLKSFIFSEIYKIDKNNISSIERVSEHILNILKKITLDGKQIQEINEFLKKYKGNFFAVRSSGVSEDSFEDSWAGEFESFLNVEPASVVSKVYDIFLSEFMPKALFYRLNQKHTEKIGEVKIGVIIQEMIQSEISGVTFSVHPITQHFNEILVESVTGLGSEFISGRKKAHQTILYKDNDIMINDYIKIEYLKKIKEQTIRIESFFHYPVDIEWAFFNQELFILQVRPITTLSSTYIEQTKDKYIPENALIGEGVFGGIVFGKVKKINNTNVKDVIVSNDDILVLEHISPDFIMLIAKAKGLIIEEGGLTSHTSILIREFHKPALINVKNITNILKDGEIIELNSYHNYCLVKNDIKL